MEVTIAEKQTGKVVVKYTINLQGHNYTPSDEEYFSEAWRCAIEDGEVDVNSRPKYSISLSN